MKHLLPFFILLLLLPGLSAAQKKEEKRVRACFEGYKSAILNDKGPEAVDYIDNKTLKYYEDILLTTKQADSAAINDLGVMDKLMVFSLRHRTEKAEILGFDGKSLFVYAVKAGMVAKSSVANSTLGKVQVEGSFAKGQLLLNGTKTPFNFHFYEEGGTWKIDLTSIFVIGSTTFNTLILNSGLEENEYLFNMLELVTGTKPGSEIWDKIE